MKDILCHDLNVVPSINIIRVFLTIASHTIFTNDKKIWHLFFGMEQNFLGFQSLLHYVSLHILCLKFSHRQTSSLTTLCGLQYTTVSIKFNHMLQGYYTGWDWGSFTNDDAEEYE